MTLLSTQQREVLGILSGCPVGTTDYNLTTRFNIKTATLVELAKVRFVAVREHRLANSAGKQCWVGITELGRSALEQDATERRNIVRNIMKE